MLALCMRLPLWWNINDGEGGVLYKHKNAALSLSEEEHHYHDVYWAKSLPWCCPWSDYPAATITMCI